MNFYCWVYNHNQVSVDDSENWPITGEVPSSDPNWLTQPSKDHFESRAQILGSNLKSDHEVSTTINEEQVSVLSAHKKEIAAGVILAGLTVAGIFKATKKLQLRHKK
jgi:hypothetical protein